MKGQVWVETVVYLLVAFVMIGLVLSFIKPKIEELKDKSITEQSIEILKNIDNSILTMGDSGNKRVLDISIRKGSLIIDSENNSVIFQMDSTYIAGEPGEVIYIGNIQTLTEVSGRNSKITLTRYFGDVYNITYNGEKTLKTLNKAPTPYRLSITNNGQTGNKINMDFSTE